ncbi:MAG: Glycosyl transferase, group 1 [Candidatus Curtissbacteria bacterium GW2011_GWA1_40_47]|uniref:Glycosyl transferase family 1 domain-containing protein n=1 Tax=Candidatus Curtissbacteria bacterium RIFOXYA1_FULL_41_14 TaxID=1797737 RepID=A0A1F5HAP9_9BACT|nr:MAG: Glycosyl transferase, group 1 [Candidatus Curtissbacteria bacterium GW2011_GWB1_40_28]KKR62347.1 MAG: glycosyl transferase, group 1 [Microgenomates group bacterium GW2011_GWC1_40_35]KKR66452.1 MAG: Glycosyl transferase, group 1 [Candidatus Curtissbacteria bacterium GW2011_GWA1_40_47]KKR77888.1 MAG: Glycosyl transferase, group 1 [Candidatus Curtissbacteria bacterium GW2011_GWD1_40_8]KKS02515.1 MAG: Glycosyl transferase, group 1 [Candidatus Curtissbacteria bacterium GW2011_GWC2_41_21]OGD
MKLGLVLAIGESFSDLKKHGQDTLVRDQNLKAYSKQFKKVYVFSYAKESYPLFVNNKLVTNNWHLHRYLYAILMPLLNSKEFKDCDVLRGFQTTGGIPCLLAKLLYSKPFVINYGYDYESVAKLEGKKLIALIYRFINFIVLKFADAVIVTSPSFLKRIQKRGVKNIHLIPNSVDINLFNSRVNKRPNEIKKIIFVGRLEPQKNLSNLLIAVKNLKYKRSLILIGEGSQKEEILQFASANSLDVKIIDSVAHNKLPEILRSADIFVLPSFIEGHPKSLLEAMAMGLPCVGTDVEGIREIIKDNETGILTGTKPKDIKKGLENVFTDGKLAQKIGKNARLFVREHFNSSVLLAKEIKLLKSQVR